MQAHLLDVTEHEKCVLDFSLFQQLLEVLILQHVLIDGLLLLRQGNPDDQVCFLWKLGDFEGSADGLGADDGEDVVFGSAQEMVLVLGSELAAELLGYPLLVLRGILEQPFFNLVLVLPLKSVKAAEDLGLDKIKN